MRRIDCAKLALVIAIGTGGCSARRAAAEPAAPAQETFASPEEAISALRAAVEIHDKAELHHIFGPGFREMLTGDEAVDQANSKRFAAALTESVKPVPDGDAKVVLEIGQNKWPFPFPLIRANSAWRFDAAAGKEEILNRHIGKDELHAIGACGAYVEAQKMYAGLKRDSLGTFKYAEKFKSNSGAMDGLYWEASPLRVQSPLGAELAEADVYGNSSAMPRAFHGYFFRVLTRQGAAASGGELNYIKDGGLTAGFALAAYPANWGRSGVMTFIVAQDGKIYQRDLGEKTSQLAAAIREYNPDNNWTLVKDQGVMEKSQ